MEFGAVHGRIAVPVHLPAMFRTHATAPAHANQAPLPLVSLEGAVNHRAGVLPAAVDKSRLGPADPRGHARERVDLPHVQLSTSPMYS